MHQHHTYFLHGLDSSGKGTKGQFFTKNFPHILCPDFAGSLEDRLDQFEKLCHHQRRLILIGSSFGGLMAACYAAKNPEKVIRLILLAPALNFAEYKPPSTLLQVPTLLVIGEHDVVTPAAIVTPLAKATFADLKVRLEDDDHLLHKSFYALNWQALLDD